MYLYKFDYNLLEIWLIDWFIYWLIDWLLLASSGQYFSYIQNKNKINNI
jgi:hypothetical protein